MVPSIATPRLPEPVRQAEGPSNGAHIHGLMTGHCKRLVKQHAKVLDNRDTEPLHQMRVAMRRLRTCLIQFEPALELPAGVSARRLARSGHRLGMARDLDVLRERLEDHLMPALDAVEQQQLRPVLKRLRRERRDAQQQLRDELNSSRYLKLIKALQGWLQAPAYTALGREPLQEWLVEWQWPWLGNLLLHPAWWFDDIAGEGREARLHDLRKGIKGARYRLENLQPLAGATASRWVERLKLGQELLGDLHDLAVLREAIDRRLTHGLPEQLPGLERLLLEQRTNSWTRWRELARELMAWPKRRELLQRLVGDASPQPTPTTSDQPQT